MFTRVKKSRDSEYLQVVENYRDGDRVRQRLVFYVGHYDSLEHALKWIAGDVSVFRRRATQSERAYETWPEDWFRERAERDRRVAEERASKLETLRALVKENPGLLETDRKRAERVRHRASS